MAPPANSVRHLRDEALPTVVAMQAGRIPWAMSEGCLQLIRIEVEDVMRRNLLRFTASLRRRTSSRRRPSKYRRRQVKPKRKYVKRKLMPSRKPGARRGGEPRRAIAGQ